MLDKTIKNTVWRDFLIENYLDDINFLIGMKWFDSVEEVDFEEEVKMSMEDFDLTYEEAVEGLLEFKETPRHEYIHRYVLWHIDLETLKMMYELREELEETVKFIFQEEK